MAGLDCLDSDILSEICSGLGQQRPGRLRLGQLPRQQRDRVAQLHNLSDQQCVTKGQLKKEKNQTDE